MTPGSECRQPGLRRTRSTGESGDAGGPPAGGHGQGGRAIKASRSELLDELFGPRGAPDTLGERLLRTCDVAALFQVSERTVSEWGRRGRIPSVRTPSGHRRYPASAIKELLIAASEGGPEPASRAGEER